MTIVLAVVVGIVLALVVAAILAAVAAAVLGAALAAVLVPYGALKAYVGKLRAVPEPEPEPEPAFAPAESQPLDPQPVIVARPAPGWLRPVAALLIWSGLIAPVDSAVRK